MFLQAIYLFIDVNKIDERWLLDIVYAGFSINYENINLRLYQGEIEALAIILFHRIHGLTYLITMTINSNFE
jgi:hypothetical protein